MPMTGPRLLKKVPSIRVRLRKKKWLRKITLRAARNLGRFQGLSVAIIFNT